MYRRQLGLKAIAASAVVAPAEVAPAIDLLARQVTIEVPLEQLLAFLAVVVVQGQRERLRQISFRDTLTAGSRDTTVPIGMSRIWAASA